MHTAEYAIELSPRTGSLDVAIARGNTPADTGRRLPADFLDEDSCPHSAVGVTEASALDTCRGGMVLEENSSPGSRSLHETPQALESAPSSALPSPSVPSVSSCSTPQFVSEAQAHRYAKRKSIYEAWQALKAQGRTLQEAEKLLGVSDSTLSRLDRTVLEKGLPGLADDYHRCGNTSRFTLNPDEAKDLQTLYTQSNRTRDAGSMLTACKFFALRPETREDLRAAILFEIERARVPRFCKRVLEKVTAIHIGAYRQPKMLATAHFAGSVGAHADDKVKRLRVVESDDGTLNFAAWFPWEMGGDPCSDRFKVRIGRWQFLPAIESGWSHMYLGYSLVARPRGSYTQEDVRGVISMVGHQHGLPDKFRFERGTWESNSVTNLLKNLGVELETVYQSNQKPYVEGGFSKLWTYLSMIDGQVGRYRGEMEQEGKLLQKCQTGRADPRDHFPSIDQCLKALDGAMAMHNSDTIDSIYGKWVPEVRYQQLAEERPWKPLPAELDFLFAPWVKEWTVGKGTVGRMVRILPDLETPCYFSHEELWRWNGKQVRLYFDPTQAECTATIVSMQDYAGYKPGDIICRAQLFGKLPHFARAAAGWATGACPKPYASHKGQVSAVRREVRALAPGGRVKSTSSEVRDGHGNGLKAESGQPSSTAAPAHRSHQSHSSHQSLPSLEDDDFAALSGGSDPAPLAPTRRSSSSLSSSAMDEL